MTKTFLYALILAFLSLSVIAPNASAQKKKRVVFKKGYAEVSGTIKGAETLEYVFRAKKNADLEMSIDNREGPYPKFVLVKPNGRLFYEKDSVNYGIGTDLMELVPQTGDYTIRLQLPEDMRNDGKPVKFTLRITIK